MLSEKNMTGIQRREEMIRLIRAHGELTVKDMMDRFDVSDMTVRRDFHTLEQQGIVTLFYGGAKMREMQPAYPDFSLRQEKNHEGKRCIALKASSYIKENDVIFLDASTTVQMMLSFIPTVRYTVITNSPAIIDTCMRMKNVQLHMAPGCYQDQYGGSLDHTTVEYLSRFHYDRAFFGTSAIEARFGVSGTGEIEAALKRSVWYNTDQSFLLFDHSKYGKRNLLKYNDIRDYNILLSDAKLDADARKAIRMQGGNLQICY